MTVAAAQRLTRQRPCPVCGGYDQAGRGQGVRCWGFVSEDGRYAHCTRAEQAGRLELTDGSETYAHWLIGDCGCGVEHEPRPVNGAGSAPRPRRRVVATYDYPDEVGDLLMQEVKYEPKDFSQRRPDGRGGWIWNLKGVRLVPYRLPELIAADPGERVYIPEGPKDVDRLVGGGLVATTNPMGAKKWRPEYDEPFRDRHVVILADNDEDGRTHAQLVARSLFGLAVSIKVLEFPDLPEHGDVSDWLDAGGTPEELVALAEAAPAW